MLILPQNDGSNYKRKYAINFDLSIDKLTQFYSQTFPKNAYKDISKYMEKNGFTHRQWSGYVSNKTMSRDELMQFTVNLYNHFPWLINCVEKMDATVVTRTYDLQATMYNMQQAQLYTFNRDNNMIPQDNIEK